VGLTSGCRDGPNQCGAPNQGGLRRAGIVQTRMQSTPPDLARSALEAAPDAMIIIDDSGIIRFANRQVSALFGYPYEAIIGKPVEYLMPERFRDRHVAHRQNYTAHVRVRPMGVGLDLFGQRRDGTQFPVEISLSPVEDARGVLIAAAIRDVSDRKRVEAALNVAHESAERARKFADRANEAKSRFLATASHDLRQPLQTLSLLNGALRRTVADPEALQALGQQGHAIDAMSRLLNALLDISKLESGAVKPDPADFAVNALFEQLRLEFAGVAASKGLSFKVAPCRGSVHSDRSLLEQILKNLVSNAIKYTRQGWVALNCRHESPSSVHIEVLDTGIGIPADHLPYIYDEFYQVGVPTNSSREGYGLGLSIVRRLVTLLDLKLEVSSEVGNGSRFSLTLPVGLSEAQQAPPQAAEPLVRRQTGQPRILIVEDDASVRNATRMLLKGEGYSVAAVATLAEALQQGTGEPSLDLLLTDYHLRDGETGMQVIGSLRGALGFPLRAILVTGDTSKAMQELPTDPYLRIASKPMRPEELLRLLSELLGV
jgi:two-component system, sensor histidine kinase